MLTLGSVAIISMCFCIILTELTKQFVWRAHYQSHTVMPEFNKINVIKELLNDKYNFASVSVHDYADIVSKSLAIMY